MIIAHHPLKAVADHGDLYDRYPHGGDCTGTRCAACGCCCHCKEDGHCQGTDGCWDQDCGCPDLTTTNQRAVADVPTGGVL